MPKVVLCVQPPQDRLRRPVVELPRQVQLPERAVRLSGGLGAQGPVQHGRRRVSARRRVDQPPVLPLLDVVPHQALGQIRPDEEDPRPPLGLLAHTLRPAPAPHVVPVAEGPLPPAPPPARGR